MHSGDGRLQGVRILFVVYAFHTNLYSAARALIAAGADVRLFTRRAAAHQFEAEASPNILGDAPDRAAVARMFRDVAPDVVIMRWEGNDTLCDWINAEAKRAGAKRIEYTQDPVTQTPGIVDRAKRWLTSKPHVVMTPVRLADDRTDRVGASVFLPLPVDKTDGVARVPRAPGAPLRIMMVGKLSQRRKGHLKVLEYLDRLAGADKVALTIVGADSTDVGGGSRDYLDEVARAAAKPRAAARVALLRNVPYREMTKLYLNSDICVLPSYAERLGTSPLEGMPYGVVPALTRSAGSAGYLEHGVDGLLLREASADEMDRLFTPLIDDQTALDTLSAAAIRTYERLLHPERFVTAFAELVDRVEP